MLLSWKRHKATFRWFPLLGLALNAGCLVVRPPPGQPGNDGHGTTSERAPQSQAEMHAATERRFFPETTALLEKADSALDAKNFDDALASARKASETLLSEYGATSQDVSAAEAEVRVDLQEWMLEGLALRALGQDVEALLAVRRRSFEWHGCRIDLRDRCREHAEWLAKRFPGIVDDSSTRLRSATSLAIAGELSDLDMNVSEREILAKKGYVGVVIEPTASKPATGGVQLRVEGKTTQGSYDECSKVGTVRIGDSDFDMKRCHDHAYTAHRADFVATVTKEDATKLTGTKGERVFLVFDVKGWKKSGSVYSCGSARVAYVIPPRTD